MAGMYGPLQIAEKHGLPKFPFTWYGKCMKRQTKAFETGWVPNQLAWIYKCKFVKYMKVFKRGLVISWPNFTRSCARNAGNLILWPASYAGHKSDFSKWKSTGSEKKTLTPSSRITEEGFTDANLSCGVAIRQYLEDHPRTCKWVGSPALISHVHGHLEGELPNLTGMILHVWCRNNMWCVLYFFGIPSILDIWWHIFRYLDICFIGVWFLLLECSVVPGCIWHTTKKQQSNKTVPSTFRAQ